MGVGNGIRNRVIKKTPTEIFPDMRRKAFC
jgi:hypothetical protein